MAKKGTDYGYIVTRILEDLGHGMAWWMLGCRQRIVNLGLPSSSQQLVTLSLVAC